MREEILQFTYEKLLPSVDMNRLKIDADMLEVRRFFVRCKPIHGMMIYLDREDAENGALKISHDQFILSDTVLSCEVFREFSSCQIKSAMAYLISCSPDAYESYRIGELNYHFIQNACMDLVRNIIMQNFRMFTTKEYGVLDNLWFSNGFGPGYYGMSVEQGKKIHRLLKGERIGVTYCGEMMVPLKSSIGVAFSYTGPRYVDKKPCDYCTASDKDCLFCGGML